MSDQTQEEVVEEKTEVEQTTQTESTPESEASTEEVSTEAAAGEAAPETEKVEEQAFAPNFNYKVYGEEKQFPEWMQPLIVNKEVEDYFRSREEKAGGFDGLKEKHETAKLEHEQVQKDITDHYVPLEEAIGHLRQSVSNKDFDKFFEQAGIKKSQIMEWAVQQAQLTEMEPEQKAAYQNKLDMTRKNTELQNENQVLTSQYEEAQVGQRGRELDLVLEDPTVNQVMQDFDQRKGKIGAFREEVIMHGYGRLQASGQDITARDAVNGLLGIIGVSVGGEQPSNGGSSTTSVVRPVQNKPVIPNIEGRSTSPVGRKMPKTLDELRKYADEFNSR